MKRITIEARTGMGGRAFINRTEKGRASVSLSNGIAASPSYAGIRYEYDDTFLAELSEAKDATAAIAICNRMAFRGTTFRIIAGA